MKRNVTTLLFAILILLSVPLARCDKLKGAIFAEWVNSEDVSFQYTDKTYFLKVILVDSERYPLPDETIIVEYSSNSWLEKTEETGITDENGEVVIPLIIKYASWWDFRIIWEGDDTHDKVEDEFSVEYTTKNMNVIDELFYLFERIPGYDIPSLVLGVILITLMITLRDK